ncbi:MAG: hypothetical protein AAF567_24175 [Actinomycetota bacterium]
MRKQYHFQPSANGRAAWDVHRLIEVSADLAVVEVPLTDFDDVLDSIYWFDDMHRPTVRMVALHARLIEEADLSYPIILGADGRVMDGMHRICKAIGEGRSTISARRFEVDPPPDYVDVQPDELPYD